MAQEKKYRLSTGSHNGGFIFSGDSCIVPKDLFEKVLQMSVKEITKDQPTKYDEVLASAKKRIDTSGKSLLISGVNFKYSKKP